MKNSNVNFNTVIANLIETAEKAWNDAAIEKFRPLLEDDIFITMEAVTIGGIHFDEINLRGVEAAIDFMKKYRKKLPLRYQVEYNPEDLAKQMIYRKYFYEIKVWAHFDCTISEYGKYKEFHISNYKNVNAKKITALYILKNFVRFNINNLFFKKPIEAVLKKQ